MIQVYADDHKTPFNSPDEIITHLIGAEEVLAVCPGRITVDPPPASATGPGPRTNPLIYVVVWGIFILIGFIALRPLRETPELIILLFLSPLIISFFIGGNRLRPGALIITADNIWVLSGVIYNVKTRSFYYHVAFSFARIGVKKLSSAGSLRTLKLQFLLEYKVTILQQYFPDKTKYYKKKTIDINEAKKMLT